MTWGRSIEDAHLWAIIDEMDEEMEAIGIEDATEWEHFGEYEGTLYLIAERAVERERREYERKLAAETAERDQLIELVETAEESAMAELAVFGCIEFEPQFNWRSKSTPEDRGWSRAVLDIIAEEGADVAESVFELY